MNVTKQQIDAFESLQTAITNFYKVIAPTASEIDEANNKAVDDLENHGASDLQVAQFAYETRNGE